MVTPHKFVLTGLLLEVWRLRDYRSINRNILTPGVYEYITKRVIKASKAMHDETARRIIDGYLPVEFFD